MVAANRQLVAGALPLLEKVAGEGSVITNDQYMAILQKLVVGKQYYSTVLPLIMKGIKEAPENQFPKYAEDSFKVLQKEDVKAFAQILGRRIHSMESDTKRKRLEKVLLKAEKLLG